MIFGNLAGGKPSLPTLSDWQRVLAFNAAHLPQIPPHHDDIGLDG